jgi:heat shock protein HtpX
VICATTGIMRRLDERELEGVLSHELSHVAHRDVTVMTIASFVGVLAGFLTRMVLWSGMMGGGRRNNNDNNGTPVVLIVLLVSIVVYALSFLLTRTLSRYRELAADRAGAYLTGQPSSLASALTKISGEMGKIPVSDLRQAEAFNAFFFAPAIAKGFSLSSVFSTHPSLEKRLEQLGRISADLGRSS